MPPERTPSSSSAAGTAPITRRLAELAKLQGKPAFHIETAEELPAIDIEPYRRIGVSAGASTPNWIIDRVVDHLTGRQGKREEFLRHLFKIWVFAVRTDIYSAAGAGCLSLAAMLLQGLPVNPLHILTASLYVYAMHVLNRFINRKTSSISSFREESYLLHEKIYVTLAVLSHDPRARRCLRSRDRRPSSCCSSSPSSASSTIPASCPRDGGFSA